MRILTTLLLLITLSGATTVIQYVNPDNAGTQDGDARVTGYERLSLALDALDNTAYDTLIIRGSGIKADTTNAYQIQNSNWSNCTGALIIEGDPDTTNGAHSGIWSTSHYRLSRSSTGTILRNRDFPRLVIRNIQIENTSNRASAQCFYSTYSANTTLDGVLFSVSDSGNAIYLESGSGYTNITNFYNCLFYRNGTLTANTANEGVFLPNLAGTVKSRFYNCVFVNWDDALESDAGNACSLWVYNTAIMHCTDDFDNGTAYWAIDRVAGSDGDGTNPVSPANWNSCFVDTSTYDYHINSTANDLTNAGTNYYSIFTTDVDGDAQPASAAWNIGFDAPAIAEGNDISGTSTITISGYCNAFDLSTQVTVTYVATSGGSISGSNPQNIIIGQDGTQVEAVANGGYEFLGWSLDNVQTATRTETNVQGNMTITAHFGAIDHISSGYAEYGTGGRYKDYNHAIRNIYNPTGNIQLKAVSDVTIYTRENIGAKSGIWDGDMNGYTLEIDGGGYTHYCTGTRQSIYVVDAYEFPTSTIHDMKLVADNVDNDFAVMGCFPRYTAHTANWYNIVIYVKSTSGDGSHPFYLNGGSSNDPLLPPAGAGEEGLTFNLSRFFIVYPDPTAINGKNVFECNYLTPGLHLFVENGIIYSQAQLAGFTNAPLETGSRIANVAIFGSQGDDFDVPAGTTYDSIMTSDATGTGSLINTVFAEQYQSIDTGSAVFGVPVASSLAATHGADPVLSSVDYNGDAWPASDWSIGPIQFNQYDNISGTSTITISTRCNVYDLNDIISQPTGNNKPSIGIDLGL